jgi:hypothetical protein
LIERIDDHLSGLGEEPSEVDGLVEPGSLDNSKEHSRCNSSIAVHSDVIRDCKPAVSGSNPTSSLIRVLIVQHPFLSVQ